jgi:hypothetical protein
MFSITFQLYMKCKDGDLAYERFDELPFVSYPCLCIEDDAVGEFEIQFVRWSGSERRFYCQSNFTGFEKYSMRTNKKRLKQAGWKAEEYDEYYEVRPRRADLHNR